VRDRFGAAERDVLEALAERYVAASDMRLLRGTLV